MTAPRSPLRRFLRIRLRTLLILLTLVATSTWLIYRQVQHAQWERELAQLVKGLGGVVVYDWQVDEDGEWPNPANGPTASPGSKWLKDLLGDEHFQSIIEVHLSQRPILTSTIPVVGQRDSGADRPLGLSRLRVTPVYHVLRVRGTAVEKGANERRILQLVQLVGSVRRLVMGGDVHDSMLVHLRNARRLELLDLSGADITGEGLRHLEGLPALVELNLGDTQVHDAALQSISRIPELRILHLNGTQIVGSRLHYLARLEKLEQLDLSDSKLSGRHVAKLSGVTSLRALDLGAVRGPIEPEALNELRSLTELRELNASGIENLSIDQFPMMPELKNLQLSKARVRRAGLEAICQLPQLERLDLSAALTADEDALLLMNVPSLKWVDLRGNRLATTTIERLIDARPTVNFGMPVGLPASALEEPAVDPFASPAPNATDDPFADPFGGP